MALGLAFVRHGECLGFPVHCCGYQTDKELSGRYVPVGLTPAMMQKFTLVKEVAA